MTDALADRQAFFRNHPLHTDLPEFFSEFLGTHRTCNPGSTATYEEMYVHMYGDRESDGCDWCQEHYLWRKRYARSFNDPEGKKSSRELGEIWADLVLYARERLAYPREDAVKTANTAIGAITDKEERESVTETRALWRLEVPVRIQGYTSVGDPVDMHQTIEVKFFASSPAKATERAIATLEDFEVAARAIDRRFFERHCRSLDSEDGLTFGQPMLVNKEGRASVLDFQITRIIGGP